MTCTGCNELIVLNMPGTILCNRCAYPDRYQTEADRLCLADRKHKRKQKDAELRVRRRGNVSMLGI